MSHALPEGLPPMGRVLAAYGLVTSFLIGCNVQPDQEFWLSRPVSPDGKLWQIYYDAAWHDVVTDGVRPPSYAAPHILRADNRFLFSGQLDTAGVSRTELPVLRLAAWNILPPVRRQIVEGEMPDTTGARWLTRDDFPALVDYQRFSLLAASIQWPWDLRGVEVPLPAGDAPR